MKSIYTSTKVRFIVLQIIGIVFLSLLFGEISLRIYNYFRPSFVFYNGSYNRFRGKPFAEDWDFTLNSRGFKDKEFSDKQDNTYRILGIGDSFSFGVVPYKDNYLTLLEQQLDLLKTHVEVLNMGIPSIGPKDYLSLLVKEGLALKPDMVLLSFFTGNDFTENGKKKFHEYFYVASLLNYSINLQSKYEGKTIHGKGKYCDKCASFSHEQYLKIEQHHSFIYVNNNKKFSQLLDRAIYYLQQMKIICERLGIEFVVVIIPDEVQVNQELLKEVRSLYYPEFKSSQWDVALPNRKLLAALSSLEIEALDLYPYFTAASSKRLYRPRDTHWNIAGNQLAATVITNFLSDRLGKVDRAKSASQNKRL